MMLMVMVEYYYITDYCVHTHEGRDVTCPAYYYRISDYSYYHCICSYSYYSCICFIVGSTGLDLSFATHIFLLERIADPALRNQIVSRANRMGATGPVHVQLLQVKSLEEDEL